MSARVFIWVQHLLGFGHFARARVVAEALRDAGHDVTLVSGGVTPRDAVPSGVAFVQLPAARAKNELFDELVDANGRDVDRTWREGRRDALLAAFREAEPDVVITETFPFGRRLLEFELLALLEAARQAPQRVKVVSSVRDVLQRPRKDERAMGMVARARDMYDAVIVHSDPSVIRLEQSFEEMAGIASRCVYTGYICADVAPSTGARHEVLVSAGGGAAGREMIAAAVAARAHSKLKSRPWTFVTGPLSEDYAPIDGVTMVRSLPDFRDRLAGAAVSVSQAGYNTLLETVKTGTPSVVVPFETDREQEQLMRAEAFAALGLVKVVRSSALEAKALAQAIDLAAGSVPPHHNIDFRGAAGTARAVQMVLKR
ncbi:MAG: glycosyltransferase [Alphaproteobacteria bacterium]|nr:glycosyltransferase [Alphaproteobacteria bacterium]